MNTMLTRRSLLAAAIVAVVPEAVFADTEAQARAAIQALYNKENAAAGRKDAKGTMANNAPDYIYYDSRGGQANMAQLQTQTAQMFQSARSVNGRTLIDKFTLKGDTATVEVREIGRVVLTNPQTKKPTNMDVTGRSRDFWVKTNGVWKKKQTRSISSTLKVDGKIVQQ